MMARDALGWVCHQHGRVVFTGQHGGRNGDEQAAAEHLRTEHPELWRIASSATVEGAARAN